MVDILKQRKKKFIDFCAGIGGGRLGLSLNGCECIGYSEIDSNPEKTYNIFFGYNEKNYVDLMKKYIYLFRILKREKDFLSLS